MRYLYIITILIIFTSCHRSTYYVYEQGDTYATIEITKDNEFIYRAKSVAHYLHSDFKKYFYLNSNNVDNFSKQFLSIGEGFIINFIGDNDYIGYCSSKVTSNFLFTSYLTYIKNDKDSIHLLWSKKIKNNLLNEPCFKKTGLTWFPPYLKRIKKIDYSKFNLPYKKKYLETMNPKYR